MRSFLIPAAIVAVTAIAVQKVNAQETLPIAPPASHAPATADGIVRQSEMPALSLITSMHLDLSASADAGVPVARATTTYAPGERIALYTKMANVGRTNPGAFDAYMALRTRVIVADSAGRIIIDQMVAEADFDAVPYPYEGTIPDAYFDSFKINILSLQQTGTYRVALIFTDMTRPMAETPILIVDFPVTIQ